MNFQSVNPADGTLLRSYPFMTPEALDAAVAAADRAQQSWRRIPVARRAERLAALGAELRKRRRKLAEIMAIEMGKPLREAVAEVEKCALACEYYSEHGPRFLRDMSVAMDDDSAPARIVLHPLGLVLAIMPWNFPLWQVVRAAVPTLLAGNGVLLKHAPNVPRCALALVDLFRAADVPEGLFANLFIDIPATGALIADRRVQGVTLTGSTRAGRDVARIAGSRIKSCVLELGGSDPYIVLEDADLERAVEACVVGRLLNAGQSCIAAKRMIVHSAIVDDFTGVLVQRMAGVRVGDPLAETTDVGPLARRDLRDRLDDQVQRSTAAGATCLLGGRIPKVPGWYYPVTVLTGLRPGMPAHDEEVFGPVACILGVDSEEEAIRVANDTPWGLGAAIFTRDIARGERIARDEIEAGSCFVNDFVRSDPRLPFGGIRESGFGRELADFGIREFVNVKTIRVMK